MTKGLRLSRNRGISSGSSMQGMKEEIQRPWVHFPMEGNILLLDFFRFFHDSVESIESITEKLDSSSSLSKSKKFYLSSYKIENIKKYIKALAFASQLIGCAIHAKMYIPQSLGCQISLRVEKSTKVSLFIMMK